MLRGVSRHSIDTATDHICMTCAKCLNPGDPAHPSSVALAKEEDANRRVGSPPSAVLLRRTGGNWLGERTPISQIFSAPTLKPAPTAGLAAARSNSKMKYTKHTKEICAPSASPAVLAPVAAGLRKTPGCLSRLVDGVEPTVPEKVARGRFSARRAAVRARPATPPGQ
jgi:hypothetical protein